MRRRGLQPFIWPLALLAVSAVLIGVAQGLATIDGFRLYGVVQAFGEIVGAIGLVWLAIAATKAGVRRRTRERQSF